ncbi:MAG: TIGR04255 family protein [Microscillaceae bacterium]|nr:TIGR04255 family protein [Microscillaceae bacterium]
MRFDFEEYNVYNYLRENLHIDIKQSFYETQENPYSLNLRFNYQIDFGKLEVHLQQAKKNNTDEDGILIRTVIADAEANSDETYIINWLDQAHQITSQIFRKMTEGELYESFKSSKYYDRIK